MAFPPLHLLGQDAKALSSALYRIHGVKENKEALVHISEVWVSSHSYMTEDKVLQLYTPEV